jgi:hypothetical protein
VRAAAKRGCCRSFAQDLLDARDRLVDGLLRGDAVSDDATDGLAPDVLLIAGEVQPVSESAVFDQEKRTKPLRGVLSRRF